VRRSSARSSTPEIDHIRNQSIDTLPYGLQKRVELARALAMRPRVLLLDEPVAGTNREETEDMARYILDVQEEASPSSWSSTTWDGDGHLEPRRLPTSARSSPAERRTRRAIPGDRGLPSPRAVAQERALEFAPRGCSGGVMALIALSSSHLQGTASSISRSAR
jgi:hypothetical protein